MAKKVLHERLPLMATAVLSAYQVAVGIEGLGTAAIVCYTIAFGVLLVASLLLAIFGLEALDQPLVVIVAAVIPLSLSLGLVVQYLPSRQSLYTVVCAAGLAAIVITRFASPGAIATGVLALVHGLAGLLIFGLPIVLSLRGDAPAGFVLVSVGGALIGLGGLLLAFLRAGRSVVPRRTIYAILPGLLLLTTAAFVIGFALA
jgi:hypothetical protein